MAGADNVDLRLPVVIGTIPLRDAPAPAAPPSYSPPRPPPPAVKLPGSPPTAPAVPSAPPLVDNPFHFPAAEAGPGPSAPPFVGRTEYLHLPRVYGSWCPFQPRRATRSASS